MAEDHFRRDYDKDYEVVGLKCPDCGPGHSIVISSWEGDSPESGRCSGCHEIMYFVAMPRSSSIRAIEKVELPTSDTNSQPSSHTNHTNDEGISDDDYA